MLVEIIATSVEEAITAQEYGAGRIELIHSFADGGLSPQLELTKVVCEAVAIPVNVMVRPHGNSFYYSVSDLKQIEAEIDYLLSSTQVNDLVFGALDSQKRVDFAVLERILRRIEGSGVGLTFHRAIDESVDILGDFILLQGYATHGVRRVLTSGGAVTAPAGAKMIAKLQQQVMDRTSNHQAAVAVLAGAGITPLNVAQLVTTTQVNQIHLGSGVRQNHQLTRDLFVELFNNLTPGYS
jgi:copper homeostasis protein